MKIVLTPKMPGLKKATKIVFEEGGVDRIIQSGLNKELVFLAPDAKKMNNRRLVTLIRRIITTAKSARANSIAVKLSDITFANLDLSDEEIVELFSINAEMSNFEFVKYKSKPKSGWDNVNEIYLVGKFSRTVVARARKGQTIGKLVNECRILANTPGGEMTPSFLAQSAEILAKDTKIIVKSLGVEEMNALKMGAVLGVGKGSNEEPKFIIMEYFNGKKEDKPIVLVGKGVTFDTGGLNLKPSEGIYEMHMDMSGGAAVIAAIVLAAKLKIKRNVVALVPAVENMPSGSSYRPGDILKSMSGKTIEILNTDAEGRVILADALTYAKKYKPALVVDVATLTGASVVALGKRASAIFSRDERLIQKLTVWGEESGDYVWPLPLWDEYLEDIKGTFADFANTGKGREGGAIAGAAFLYQFAQGYNWVHIDIAPRMVSTEGDYLAKGAAGAPVRLLIKILEKF